jgi:hypothetical protein
MKSLEKYFSDNRDRFDLEEPEDGHFERFTSKLKNLRRDPGRFSWQKMLQAAAIAILVVLSSLWVFERIIPSADEPGILTLADISAEYGEAEIYYISLINRKYNEIKSFDFHENSLEQETILRELSEMDRVYRSLEKELDAEGGNFMVINAMIRHYQLKLDIMSQILDHLYEIHGNGLNGEDDETAIT